MVRHGEASLSGAYGAVLGGELFICGMNIPVYEFGNRFNHDPRRNRKLLVHAKEIEAFIENTLTPEGRTVMDTFNLGPALVIDGEVQDIASSQAAQQGDYQWNYPQQRIALVQTGHLEYAIVEVFGQTDSTAGLTLEEFANLIAEKVPDAKIAYNFDGGGSTNLILNNKKICKTPGLREITDIIYFASAEGYVEE